MEKILYILQFLLFCQTSLAFIKLPNKFYEEFESGNGGYSFDRVLMSGRGLMTSIHVRYNDNSISTEWTDFFVFHRVYHNNAIQYTQTAVCSPADFVSGDNFGGNNNQNFWGNSALIHTPEAGNVFMMTSFAADVPAKVDGTVYTRVNGGAVYLWTGVWSKWSQQQKITLGNNALDEDWFGMSVAMNRKYYGEAAISCAKCDPLTAWNRDGTGAIYTYTAKAPLYNVWTQQQELFEYDYSLNSTGVVVDMHANTLAAMASKGTYPTVAGPFKGAANLALDTVAAYSRPDRYSRWSFSQFLEGSTFGPDDTFLRVWEDAIFVGDRGFMRAPVATLKFGGRLLIYYPDTYNKPKHRALLEEEEATNVTNIDAGYVTSKSWKGTHWSLSQTLVMPDPQYVRQQGFGGYFDVFEDTMIVLAQRNRPSVSYSGYVFVYEREHIGGQWSHQQSFIPPGYANTGSFVAPTMYHNVMSHGHLAETGGVDSVQFYYSTDTVWDCLIVSMEDQFGDGWDTAQLRVDAPDGTYDLYSPSCDSTNGLKFRYCPWDHKDVGLYKFRIEGAEKAKYYWEIQWRVFEEKTGQWFMGKHDTTMDFHWDPKDFDFTHRAIQRDLPLNITCKECKPRPTQAPSKHDRALKGKTFAPTISPAPTLSQTEGVQWEWFVMKTSTLGKSWFDEGHKGTNFYISDAKGHRLVSTGTMCPWEGAQKECWQTLPDGDYVLRVTGDLNVDQALHSWTFCGRAGTANSMITFRVSHGLCDALLGYTRATYCQRVLHTVAVAGYEIELLGLSMSDLKPGAVGAIAHAISTIFPEVAEEDISVTNLRDVSGDSIEMHIQIKVEVASLGFDPTDVESVPEAFLAFSQALKYAVESGTFMGALMATEINYGFDTITRAVYVLDTMYLGGIPEISNLEASQEYVKDFATAEDKVYALDKDEESWSVEMMVWVTEKYGAYTVAAVGYIVFASFVAALAVYTIRNPRAGLVAVKQAGEGMGEALVSAVADEEDMVLDTCGSKKMLPPMSSLPALTAKKLKTKVMGGVDRIGYSLVSTLDDIADGIVDGVLPPPPSSSSSDDDGSGEDSEDEENTKH